MPYNNPYYQPMIQQPQGASYQMQNSMQSLFGIQPQVHGLGLQQAQPINSFKPQSATSQMDTRFSASTGGAFAGNLAGGITAGVDAFSAGASIFNDIQGTINQYRDADFTQGDTSINGRPTTQSFGRLMSEVGSLGGISDPNSKFLGARLGNPVPNDVGKGLGMRSMTTGLKAGASIGSFIPGIGTAVGGVIGGVAGFVGGMFGKKKAQDEAGKARDRATEALYATQAQYNEDSGDYFQRLDLQEQQSQGERNYANRIYGINQYNDPFRQIV